MVIMGAHKGAAKSTEFIAGIWFGKQVYEFGSICMVVREIGKGWKQVILFVPHSKV